MMLYLTNPLNLFMSFFSLIIIIGGIAYFVNDRMTGQIVPETNTNTNTNTNTETDSDTDSIINIVHV